MSAMIHTATNIQDLARKLGRHSGQLVGPDSQQFVLDLKQPADVRVKLAREVGRLDAKYGDSKMDETKRHDAATAFTTSALAQILAPIFIQSAYRFLFTPGFTGEGSGLLPVQQRVALGMQESTYQVVTHTGEARRMAHGATKDLRRVGTADDQKKQPVGLYGVRFGWNEFELWQAAHLGRSPQAEQQRAASFAMAEYFEDMSSYGDTDTMIPGFFNHGNVFTIEMATNMASATADQMIDQLLFMHHAWKRANPMRMITGVAMPEAHYLSMLKLFKGAAGEGVNAWTWAQTVLPWLRPEVLKTDDRLLTASQDGFSMWQFWSADSEEQYIEASPSPLMYGPFLDELETTFILIGQHGGVINKNPRSIMRVNFLS